MDKNLDTIKRAFQENPVETIMAGSMVATAITGLGKMIVSARNSRTWRREVNRRTKMSK